MLRPRSSAGAVAAAAAIALAACGSTSDADQVRTVVKDFGTATAKHDYQAICDRLIAKALSDKVEEFGLPCELAFKQGLDSVHGATLTIRSVHVTGDRAAVQVHSTAVGQQPSDDTLQLRRQQGSWRITALGQQPAAKTSGAG